MNNRSTVKTFAKLLGQTIVDIRYIGSKFHYELSGDWTKVDTNLFPLHAPEWEIHLSNGVRWFLNSRQCNTNGSVGASIKISSSSIADSESDKHSVPNSFGWSSLLGKKINAIRFYREASTAKKILGFRIDKIDLEVIQVVQFACEGHTFSISTLSGDLGDTTFYPTGHYNDRLGIFIDKTIADSISVCGIRWKMEIIKSI